MKLWIDDIRQAPDGWIWAKSYTEGFNFICGSENIDEISFDHDLGEGPNGYNLLCAIEYLIADGYWNKKIPEFHIHSANPVGRRNMQMAIDSIYRLLL